MKRNSITITMNKFFISLSVVIVSSTFCQAQDTIPVPQKNKYNASQLWHESGAFFTSPLHWKAKNWATFVAIGGTSYLLMKSDQQLRDAAVPYRKYANDWYTVIGDEWGGFIVLPVVSLALYSYGTLANHYKTKRLGFEIAEAALFAETVSIILKGSFGRARPFTNKGADHFEPFRFLYSPGNSFPAGHVNAAFAMSTVLSMRATSPVLKVLAFAPAVGCAVSRIITDSHWGADVFLGSALGVVAGYWVVRQHNKTDSHLSVSSVYPLSIRYAIK